MNPNLNEEKKLWRMGYKHVACLDEAGRGPLAGPVVAAAVFIDSRKTESGFFSLKSVFRGIKDSKKLSPKKREEFYEILIRHRLIKWGIGIVSEKIIDKINILEASKLAMKKALKDLGCRFRRAGSKIDFLILDGNFRINSSIFQKSIVKADEKVFSCALASIIAKVTRDKIMMKYHKKYPEYGFDKHKGYPTEYHYKMIRKYGPCQIHRKSFTIYK